MSAFEPHAKTPRTLVAEPLTAAAFAPFGEVIEATGASQPINQGRARRFADLARLSLDADEGRPAVSLVHSAADDLPVPLRLMERHPLGSQIFFPVDGQSFIVVVAGGNAAPEPSSLQAFIAHGAQGVHYRRGVWHHPMIALDRACTFFEVHRAGPGANCDEVAIDASIVVTLQDTASWR